MRAIWFPFQLFCLAWAMPMSAQFFTPEGKVVAGIAAGFSTATTLAVDGDYLVVGSPEDDRQGMTAGSAQVYRWAAGGWTPLGGALFGEQPNAQMGTAVAISGHRMAISAPYYNRGQDEVGQVTVYEWTGTAWTVLGAPLLGAQARERFGASLALVGDQLVVGSSHYDGATPNCGRVQAYAWDGRAWVAVGQPLEGEAAGDEFGSTVVLEEGRLVITAPYHGYNSPTAGGVYVYDWSGANWHPVGRPLRGTAPRARFGFAIALEGDRVAVGTPDPSGVRGAGQVVVYQWSGTDWEALGAPIQGAGSGDGAGWAVAMSGDRVAIGAPEYDGGGSLAGQVQLYEWQGMAWETVGPPLQGHQTGQLLGYALDLTDNQLVVAAPGATDGSGQRGTIQQYSFCRKAPKINLQKQTNTLIAQTDAPVRYQWRHCDRHKTAIPAATFDNYTPPANGHYALSVTQGECTHLLDCTTIQQVPDQLKVAPDEVHVYPNPTFGPVTVTLDKAHRYTVVRLYNLGGKVLSEHRYQEAQELLLSLEDLPAGVYLLMVQMEDASPIWVKVHRD